MTPEKCLKSPILIKIDPFWTCRSIRGYGRKCMPKYGHGETPGTPFMTIFGFSVSPQISNIEKFEVYEGLWTPGGIPSFFS